MNVQFKASFAKDLPSIENKDLLNRIKGAIEQLEKGQNLQSIANIKNRARLAPINRGKGGSHS
ncbi:MAG: hypothetical protein DMF60_06440 [Acidobacteria bacterium]|nr:MAG: hypothetical protein DMF60_06440 [Acidobacteriota bacterium]